MDITIILLCTLTYVKACDLLDKCPSKNSACPAWTVSVQLRQKMTSTWTDPQTDGWTEPGWTVRKKIKIWISLQKIQNFEISKSYYTQNRYEIDDNSIELQCLAQILIKIQLYFVKICLTWTGPWTAHWTISTVRLDIFQKNSNLNLKKWYLCSPL